MQQEQEKRTKDLAEKKLREEKRMQKLIDRYELMLPQMIIDENNQNFLLKEEEETKSEEVNLLEEKNKELIKKLLQRDAMEDNVQRYLRHKDEESKALKHKIESIIKEKDMESRESGYETGGKDDECAGKTPGILKENDKWFSLFKI